MIDRSDYIHVAVAAIINDQQQVLLSRRHADVHQGGLWEFPGGKVEPGESVEQALVRELYEELDIHVRQSQALIQIPYQYEQVRVWLDVLSVSEFDGAPRGKEGQAVEWRSLQALSKVDMPAANRGIIRALQLPDTCLMTPDMASGQQQFLTHLEKSLQAGVRLLVLRQKALTAEAYQALAEQVISLAASYQAQVMLSLSAYDDLPEPNSGYHLNSQQLMGLDRLPQSTDILCSASCHNETEIRKANALGVDMVFLSPVKTTLSHPGAAPMGWSTFSELVSLAQMPVYALGGMQATDRLMVRQHGAQGIAAIRSLWADS